MEYTRYADVFIYVPSVREIVRIAEGNGTNLLDEDEAEGYVDYIYYDQHLWRLCCFHFFIICIVNVEHLLRLH